MVQVAFEAREAGAEGVEEPCAEWRVTEEQGAREGAVGDLAEGVDAEGEQGEGGEDAEEGEVARRVPQKPW